MTEPAARPSVDRALGAWVGFGVAAYAAFVMALNAWLGGLARVAAAGAELLGLRVALETVDEAEARGFEVFAALERIAARQADSLALEAIVAGATGLGLLLLAIGLTRGSRYGLRGAQLLLLVRITQAAALAWLVGWQLGPEALEVLRELRDTVGRDAGDWGDFDALTADDGPLRACATLLGVLCAVPPMILFWLTTRDVTRTWCGLPSHRVPAG